jgi:hypothetical protein
MSRTDPQELVERAASKLKEAESALADAAAAAENGSHWADHAAELRSLKEQVVDIRQELALLEMEVDAQ